MRNDRQRGGMKRIEKPKDLKKSFRKLLPRLMNFKWPLLLVSLLAIAASVFSIIGPKILAMVTDELAAGIRLMMEGATSGIDFGYIRNILLILVALYLLSATFQYIQGHIMAHIATKVSFQLRNDIMVKINRLPLSYFSKNSQGDVLSRITNDVDTIEQSLSQSVTQFLTSLTTMIGVFVMMLSISWQMTLVAVCIVPVSIILVTIMVKISQKHFTNQQEYLGQVNGQVEEMYGGHIVIKAFNREEKALAQFETANERLADSARKAEFFSSLMQPIMNFVGNLSYVVVCIFGAYLATKGKVSIGDIQAFIQYVRNFTQPITQLSNISNQVQRMMAAAERVFEFLNEKEEVEFPVKIHMEELQIEGHIRFEHVRFGYLPGETVIKDFTADVKAGQKVAIVGPTGAGKTTIVNLLMRFYDVTEGRITIDGHDIRHFTRQDLRSAFSMILQDTWLFNGTILDNIRYGRLDATDEEVIEAAKTAQVDHFVKTLPGTYQMKLNEESTNLSQGQKQLLTIARAVLADPKILILDEATSSVDTRTEILIQEAMDKLMEGRTSFIIAHRLSTIINADLILCMNKGDIVEQGTHKELMAKDGFYANLYNSQFDKIS